MITILPILLWYLPITKQARIEPKGYTAMMAPVLTLETPMRSDISGIYATGSKYVQNMKNLRATMASNCFCVPLFFSIIYVILDTLIKYDIEGPHGVCGD